MSKIIFPELSYQIQGVIFDVYNSLGPLWREKVFQRAMLIGLSDKGLKAIPEKPFRVLYKERMVGYYKPDILIEDKIILELKACENNLSIHQAQIISYLKVTNYKLGILVNFGISPLFSKRLPNFISNKKVFRPKEFAVDKNLKYSKITKKLIDILLEIHFILGPGFFHQVYRRATWYELIDNGIKFSLEKKIIASYKGIDLFEKEVRIFLIEKKIVLLVIAVKEISEEIEKEMKYYLKYFNYNLGMIINFKSEKLEWCFIENSIMS